VAEDLEGEAPHRVISRMARNERKAKVFIDWSQNAEHKTTVSVYSVRAKRDRPFVSMPITRAEVKNALSMREAQSLSFTPEAAVKRIHDHGDLFAPVLTMQQVIPTAVLKEAELRPAPEPAPVVIPAQRKTAYALPRSSGQGGRKLFVVHRTPAGYELAIEVGAGFQLFQMRSVPAGKATAVAKSTGTTGLQHLTAESEGSGIVWDLGTYELMEGSFETGEFDFFLSGRKLDGAWTLQRTNGAWRCTSKGGHIKRTIPLSASALPSTASAPEVPKRLRRAS
jgi:bifunctional non-homologous end joining protein LigD